MTNPTIAFTQDTLFEIFKQSALKYGLNGSAKIYVTDNGGVLKADHFPPEEIIPGGVPKVTPINELREELLNNKP
jgi:hypothetical protein